MNLPPAEAEVCQLTPAWQALEAYAVSSPTRLFGPRPGDPL